MEKDTAKVPVYTRRAVAKYKKKFSQLHVSLTPQAYEVFNQRYQQYSFNQYVNETVDLLLKGTLIYADSVPEIYSPAIL